MRGVVEVDVGLRGAVQGQRPGVRPLPVGDQLGEAAVDGLGEGLRLAVGLAVRSFPGARATARRTSTCH